MHLSYVITIFAIIFQALNLQHPNMLTYQTKPISWLKENKPHLPSFDRSEEIGVQAANIKKHILSDMLEGLELIMADNPTIAEKFGNIDDEIVLCSCLTKNYGTIYFINRKEIDELGDKVFLNKAELDFIDPIVVEHNLTNKLLNYAILKFLLSLHKMGFLYDSPIPLPPYSFWSYKPNKIYVRYEDLIQTPEEILRCADALYDVHDFAHFLCTLIDDSLYGSKLFGDFRKLDSHLQNLILSSKFLDPDSFYFTDNMLFRQLSLSLFDSAWEKRWSQTKTEEFITGELHSYLKGDTKILHPYSDATIKAKRPLNGEELCVLIQNKCYELPASEMEEQLFIRGRESHEKDPLTNLSTWSFFKKVKNSGLFYFEIRNFVRHRAIRNAYSLYAAGSESKNMHFKLGKSFINFDKAITSYFHDLFFILK